MSLPKIYEQLGSESVIVMEGLLDKLFLPKYFLEEETYLKFLLRYQKELQAIVAELLALWDTKEHRETLGHDKVHISFDLFEFLQLAQNGGLKESEKYLTLFGALLHDLGRYPELLFKDRSEGMDFSLPKQIQFHAALSGHIWLLVFEKHKSGWNMDEEDAEVCEAFFYRILGAVLYHGGKNEERDIVAHHVQSCDRLAGILGSREFVRNIVTDGVQRGAVVYPDEQLSYDKTFPLFNNLPVEKFANSDKPEGSWTNIVHYLEMPLRNMFLLSTEFGMERAKTMKRESGIILTLLSGGAGIDLYNQIFAPELSMWPRWLISWLKIFKFPKTPIPKEIWQSIKRGMDNAELNLTDEYSELPFSGLIDLILDQQAPDIPKSEREKVHTLLNVQGHKKNVRNAIQYVVARRQISKGRERNFLLGIVRNADELIGDVALELLESRLWTNTFEKDFEEAFKESDELFVVTHRFNNPASNEVGIKPDNPQDSKRTVVMDLLSILGIPHKRLREVYDFKKANFKEGGKKRLSELVQKKVTFWKRRKDEEDCPYLCEPETFQP